MAATGFVWPLALWIVVVAATPTSPPNKTESVEAAPLPPSMPPKEKSHESASRPASTATTTTTSRSPPSGLGLDLPALHRALYVLAGLAGIGLLYYLGGRTFRRTRKPPRKKYGLLKSNSEDPMEMASLESDEDTVFEIRNLRR